MQWAKAVPWVAGPVALAVVLLGARAHFLEQGRQQEKAKQHEVVLAALDSAHVEWARDSIAFAHEQDSLRQAGEAIDTVRVQQALDNEVLAAAVDSILPTLIPSIRKPLSDRIWGLKVELAVADSQLAVRNMMIAAFHEEIVATSRMLAKERLAHDSTRVRWQEARSASQGGVKVRFLQLGAGLSLAGDGQVRPSLNLNLISIQW